MGDRLPSRSELLERFKGMDESSAIKLGLGMRNEGYKIHWSPTHGTSVEDPLGEYYNESRLKVRHGMVPDPERVERAFEFLVLYEEVLQSLPNSNVIFY
jgi:hypothetical protein